MALFRKKPIVVEAWRYVDGAEPMPEWVKAAVIFADGYAEVETWEGTMIANKGDWIIRGVEGEVYPCKDSIFQATYEPLE